MKRLLLALAALSVAACGDSGTGGSGAGGASSGGSPPAGGSPSTGGAPSSGGGGEGAGVQGGAPATGGGGEGGVGGQANCNSIANVGSDVNQVAHIGTMPVGTGGTIEDGTYVLTNLDTFTDSPLNPSIVFNQTLEVSGTTAELVVNDSGDGQPEVRKTFTVTTNDNVPTITTTCTTEDPPFEIPYSSFTADSSKIRLFSTAYSFAVTYTKVGEVACSNAAVDPLFCDTPFLTGAFVVAVNQPTVPGTSAYLGGTILDGHYELEEVISYNGFVGPTVSFKGTASFCDNAHSYRTATYVNGAPVAESGTSGTVVQANNTLTASYTCPPTLGTTLIYYNIEEGGEVYHELIIYSGTSATESKYRRIMP